MWSEKKMSFSVGKQLKKVSPCQEAIPPTAEQGHGLCSRQRRAEHGDAQLPNPALMPLPAFPPERLFFPLFFLFAFASPLRRTYISHQHADSYWRLTRLFPASIHQVSIRIIPALTPCSATSFPARLPPGRFSTTLYHHCLIQFSQWFHSDEKCLISHLPTARHQGPPPPTFTTFWASSLGLSHIFNNDKLSYLKWKPSLSYIFIDANPGR